MNKIVTVEGRPNSNCECLLDLASLRFKFDEIYCSIEKLMMNYNNFSGDKILPELSQLKKVIEVNMEILRSGRRMARRHMSVSPITFRSQQQSTPDSAIAGSNETTPDQQRRPRSSRS